jgi:hypothetical protein
MNCMFMCVYFPKPGFIVHYLDVFSFEKSSAGICCGYCIVPSMEMYVYAIEYFALFIQHWYNIDFADTAEIYYSEYILDLLLIDVWEYTRNTNTRNIRRDGR